MQNAKEMCVIPKDTVPMDVWMAFGHLIAIHHVLHIVKNETVFKILVTVSAVRLVTGVTRAPLCVHHTVKMAFVI